MNPSIYTIQTVSNTTSTASNVWINPHQSNTPFLVQPQATQVQPLPAAFGVPPAMTADASEPDPVEVERMIEALLGMRRKLKAA